MLTHLRNRWQQRWLVTLLVSLAWSTSTDGHAEQPPVFVSEIQSLFVKHCYPCHAGEAAESGLRLDIKSEAFRGGEGHGPAIVPGDADASPLVRFVRGEEPGLEMPPLDANVPALSEEERNRIAAWIAAGADWPEGVDTAVLSDRRDHWAFRRVQQAAVPDVKATRWPRGPIDAFVLARLEAAGLEPTPEADRRTWLRRVTFDLTGLPATIHEVENFVADTSDMAYERVVDRLLASPRYGERYGQHWLDTVRYADTHGYEVNTERANAWPYRDWVIAALNADLPYDQFVREQLAGDAYGADEATGFLVTAAVLLPGQIGADEPSKRLARQEALADIVTNVSDTFLGLSVGCARCHDHKFDPVSQRDYYTLQAFFSGVRYEERPFYVPTAEEARERLRHLASRLESVEQDLAAIQAAAESDGAAAETAAKKAALESEKQGLTQQVAAETAKTMVFAGSFHEPDVVRLLSRGDPEQAGEVLLPRSLSAFDQQLAVVELSSRAGEQTRRLALADWITHPAHPLTSRVIVNRVWQWHFGTGLAESANDFGRNGVPPSHPELLDWLAQRLISEGWSLKDLHREIVLSATYRQGSGPVPEAALAKDADCRLLWRFPPRRLEAEAIRDSMLAVSGRLNLEMGGRGFDLFGSRGGLSGFPPIETFGPEGRRRMIYSHKIRMEKESVFGAFDCPDAGQTLPRRRWSTTPIQALNLLNSPFTIEESSAFSDSLKAEVAGEPQGGNAELTQSEALVTRAFERAIARPPDAEEMAASLEVMREHGLETLCRVLYNTNEFLFLP
ncbi:MAG: DUF1553 domain-containing protein [Pirellulales bacterium]